MASTALAHSTACRLSSSSSWLARCHSRTSPYLEISSVCGPGIDEPWVNEPWGDEPGVTLPCGTNCIRWVGPSIGGRDGAPGTIPDGPVEGEAVMRSQPPNETDGLAHLCGLPGSRA